MTKNAAIIVAGGSGKRFGSKTPKQFLNLQGIPVFLWSVMAFKKTKLFPQIILVAPKERLKKLVPYAKKYSFLLVCGGKERSDSVKAGLKAIDKDTEIVAIHDAARPLISQQVIERSIAGANEYGAVVVSVPARDTIKLASGQKVIKTIPRDTVWLAQTPQVFKKTILDKAYAKLGRAKATDDAQVVEKAGFKVFVSMGDYSNIKITDKNDFKTAQIALGKGLRN
jgi:2-C-methyl-D-erythritol 4-phosphate cytidylyltransferase